jgi:hypothetical protein
MERTLVFEALDFAFAPAGIQTRGAKVLAVQFAVAQRAQETPASAAGKDRLFFGMVETTGFAFDQQRLGSFAGIYPAKKSRKYFNFQLGLARRARNQVLPVENVIQQDSAAFGTLNQRRVHLTCK